MNIWLVQGIIRMAQILLLLGQPGNGKSWLVALLAIAVATGEKYVDKYDVQRSHVIYIDEDTPTDIFEERLNRLAAGTPLSSLPIDLRSMTGFRLYNDNDRKNLITKVKQLCAQGNNVLVIIDCLVKVMAGKNLDTTSGASEAMSFVSEIRDAGATVVLVHHLSSKKPIDLNSANLLGAALNSTMLVSSSDSVLVIQKIPIPGQTIFMIKPEPRRFSFGIEGPIGVELIEDPDKNLAVILPLDSIPQMPNSDAKEVFGMFPDSTTKQTVKTIYDGLQEDLPRNRIRAALDELVEQKCLEKKIDPHDKSHKACYMRHPYFPRLDTFYKKNL